MAGSPQLGSLSPSVRQSGARMFEQASLWVSFSSQHLVIWIIKLKMAKSSLHHDIFTAELKYSKFKYFWINKYKMKLYLHLSRSLVFSAAWSHGERARAGSVGGAASGGRGQSRRNHRE